MNLRLKLFLWLLAGTLLSAAAAAALVWGLVVAPGRARVQNLQHATFEAVVSGLDAGVPLRQLEEETDAVFRRRRRLPRHVRRRARRGHRCRMATRSGREAYLCQGRGAPVWIETEGGWLEVRLPGHAEPPDGRRFFIFLPIFGVLLGGLAYGVSQRVSRPLRRALEAIESVHQGDLTHRLPVPDAGEERVLAEAFNRMTAKVRRLLRAERELMAGMSHELRTPLTRLRLHLELLSDGSPDTERRATAMTQDVEALDALIEEMLRLSRLAIGEQGLQKEEVDLLALGEEVVPSVPSTHAVSVTGTSFRTFGDRSRLRRVLQNLVDNAVKHTPAGTPIEVEGTDTGIRVLDAGPGVSADALAQLGQPFYRAPETTTDGVGLGLMLARQIVELHGGTLRFSNRAEGGFSAELMFSNQA